MNKVLMKKVSRFMYEKPKTFTRKSMADTKHNKLTIARVIHRKHCNFARTQTKAERKEFGDRIVKKFTNKELREKLEANPYCYLSGKKIDLMDSKQYSLDHIVPLSKGGTSDIENCGLASFDANQMKSNFMLDEYRDKMIQQLEHFFGVKCILPEGADK